MGIRVAAIDCGTNSLRLLLAEAAPDGSLVEIDRRTEIVRLGEGVDASGAFTDQALTRTFAVLDDFASRLTGLDIEPDRVRMVATSAARDVSNRETFLAGVRSRIGIEPEVISGDREAGLSYVGAVSSAAVRAGLGEDPVLVVDIGGGSTELVIGTGEGLVEAAVSLPMGSVRLTERFLRGSSTHGPPTGAELESARAYVGGLLDDCALDLPAVGSAVGVAGTVVTLAWLAGVAPADRHRMPGALIPRASLAQLSDRLARLSADQIRAIPGMHPGRADVITAGALIATSIAERLSTTGLMVSIADILDALALEIVRDRFGGRGAVDADAAVDAEADADAGADADRPGSRDDRIPR